MSNKLYAWANQIKLLQLIDPHNILKGVEHTWVTDYSPGDGYPDPEKGCYWYCHGDYHNKCRPIAVGEGGIDFAHHIAVPNNENEYVGIEYGEDGLCHQMANRLLRFSFNKEGEPVTVKGAKGYKVSRITYGVYGGEPIWEEGPTDCLIKWENAVSDYQNKIEEKS